MTTADFNMYDDFSEDEFRCKCGCGQCVMDKTFMDALQQLRKQCGFAFRINSGYRCADYNASIGGGPAHPLGKAADIRVDRERAYWLNRYASMNGFTGIGWQQKGDDRFVHLDTLTKDEADPGPRPTVWSY